MREWQMEWSVTQDAFLVDAPPSVIALTNDRSDAQRLVNTLSADFPGLTFRVQRVAKFTAQDFIEQWLKSEEAKNLEE